MSASHYMRENDKQRPMWAIRLEYDMWFGKGAFEKRLREDVLVSTLLPDLVEPNRYSRLFKHKKKKV